MLEIPERLRSIALATRVTALPEYRGYVVIVPDTEVGDRATVRIENAKENVAFAEIVDRHHRLQHD